MFAYTMNRYTDARTLGHNDETCWHNDVSTNDWTIGRRVRRYQLAVLSNLIWVSAALNSEVGVYWFSSGEAD